MTDTTPAIEVAAEIIRRRKATSSKIVEATDVGKSTVYRALEALVEDGALTKDDGRPATYTIARPGHELQTLTDEANRDIRDRDVVLSAQGSRTIGFGVGNGEETVYRLFCDGEYVREFRTEADLLAASAVLDDGVDAV
ncbi:helix-turn-helix domain-containing protein [Halorubrum lacusprofundi]|jgi:DNA-binding IclR family transcriptional regulator|uniref:helix-turn-helix domain-containing protein n=1 Tax=Halorubrum lacusprofundi TaxID=2247 RepID=UPI000B5A84F4|nr:helix-turn-helix domain-containing protein [Halorubrum lacusprofundi]MCG1007940.1 helix-turn-helix domain-containing protein [Halorubrum lacusprofundi]